MKLVPDSVGDASGNPFFGTYAGTLKSCSLKDIFGEKSFVRRKRWQYQIIVTPEVIVFYAIVDLNYASSAFLTALDLSTGQVEDFSFLGLPILTKVKITDESTDALMAKFQAPGTKLLVEGSVQGVFLTASHKELSLNAKSMVDWTRALTVIAPVDGGLVNVTQKIMSGNLSGSLKIKEKRYDLSQGVMGLDYTQGYLARRTCWRWAMGMGRLADGRIFGFNLVAGINESPDTNENGFWIGDKLYPLGRAIFKWNSQNLMDQWEVETDDGKVKLVFNPKFIHKETKNLVLIKSVFAQPVGLFSGSVQLPEGNITFKDAGGVTEFQDSTW